MRSSTLLSLDAFSRTEEDVRVRTKTGALITLGCMGITFLLLLNEWLRFGIIETRPELVIDRERHLKLDLDLDVTFPNMPCDLINLDLMDDAGEIQLDILSSGFTKTRLDSRGNELGTFDFDLSKDISEYPPDDDKYCGPCYGALDQSNNKDDMPMDEKVCCQTCADVRQAYLNAGWAFFDGKDIEQCEREGYVQRINDHLNEGCRIQGNARLNRIHGNVHFAPGLAFQNRRGHYHDTSLYDKKTELTFNHIINHLSFGKHVKPGIGSKFSAASVSPLDGHQMILNDDPHNVQFIYFAKIVPTRYEYLDKDVIETAQFSTTTHSKALNNLADDKTTPKPSRRSGTPGLYINYEMSPLKVINREQHVQTWVSFILNCLTSIGGVLAVGTVIDKIFYRAQRTIQSTKKN
ncbi:hypothetical protein TBLA_0A04460 [Henningerozyma blattae CBS 6284]|uniref:Endoplasmic reticulum-Golgi intermediate compartment protein n=1 Tax=Henningerozyma blattae (strain ATCC 34711 / CBS 6284 / DSM 70876 / NBRC 10599 / NRRL Y-10934 / UCD 77-7) TaxID=1071380 RepID=I2GVT8_HENB6|nr:hypothetical protein TBLA_0A04460 [Tetrapisispora blattae CBS 6284]CCH58240.1 hypothetical protein TBLA_0A04460 [Tetrapisispora blattae CBS 6284]